MFTHWVESGRAGLVGERQRRVVQREGGGEGEGGECALWPGEHRVGNGEPGGQEKEMLMRWC